MSLDGRLRTALSIYAFSVLGLFLLVAPWTPVWSRAASVLLPPVWLVRSEQGWVRGLVSGLGALDLVVAFQIVLDFLRPSAPRSEDR